MELNFYPLFSYKASFFIYLIFLLILASLFYFSLKYFFLRIDISYFLILIFNPMIIVLKVILQ